MSHGTLPACQAVGTEWLKSSRSTNNAQCVEIRFTTNRIEVRDSKNADGALLSVTSSAWATFVAGLVR